MGGPTSVVVRTDHPVLKAYSFSINRQISMDYTLSNLRKIDRDDAYSSLISFFKNNSYFNKDPKAYSLSDLCRIYIQEFNKNKKNNNLMSFDDVISQVSSDEYPINN